MLPTKFWVFLSSSLKGEWVSSWIKYKFPFFVKRLGFQLLATIVFGTCVCLLFKRCESKYNRTDQQFKVYKAFPKLLQPESLGVLNFEHPTSREAKEEKGAEMLGVGKTNKTPAFKIDAKLTARRRDPAVKQKNTTFGIGAIQPLSVSSCMSLLSLLNLKTSKFFHL